jgi:chromosome partitioning protein
MPSSVWMSRTQRAKTTGRSRRLGAAAQSPPAYRGQEHAPRRHCAGGPVQAGRVPRHPGLSERVVYRELFPYGLTLLDLQQLGNVGLSHIAARQELREMIAGFGIPEEGADLAPQRAVAAG